MMRVLVCGGRDYLDKDQLCSVLDDLHHKKSITDVIHGAASGADIMAAQWAHVRHIQTHSYFAYWETQGKAAGPIRNQRMLDEGNPDLVVAFPGGRGTADMVQRARKAGLEIIHIGAKEG